MIAKHLIEEFKREFSDASAVYKAYAENNENTQMYGWAGHYEVSAEVSENVLRINITHPDGTYWTDDPATLAADVEMLKDLLVAFLPENGYKTESVVEPSVISFTVRKNTAGAAL